MKAVYALYASPESAQIAVDGLRAAGIPDREITIMSSEPLEEYEFGSRDRGTWMPWIAGLGGTIGLVTAYFLTSLTELAWPINTGGMPIVSNWPNMIILFELTMLGVVFAAVTTLLLTARIPCRLPEFYDPAISDGKILVGVADPTEAVLPHLERALRAPGMEELKTIA